METKTFITKEEFASKLDGCDYRDEMSKEEIKEAKENGLVVVFGASDDLIEFEGCISEEEGCWCGALFKINSKKLTIKETENRKDKNVIEAVWCDTELNTSWSYNTSIPHAKFNVMEDDDLYCIGIVFSIYDLK